MIVTGHKMRRPLLGLALCGLLSMASPPQLAPPSTNRSMPDLSSSVLTADQQQNNKTDRQLAQAVRKAVFLDDELSIYGHNVKIIAHGGVVTLRGPVRSEAERQRIARIALTAGAKELDNMLQIAPSR